MKYFYVDTKEMLKEPKKGKQYTAWFTGSSQNNPGGQEFAETINGEMCHIRATTEAALTQWLKMAFTRVPYIRVRDITEGGE